MSNSMNGSTRQRPTHWNGWMARGAGGRFFDETGRCCVRGWMEDKESIGFLHYEPMMKLAMSSSFRRRILFWAFALKEDGPNNKQANTVYSLCIFNFKVLEISFSKAHSNLNIVLAVRTERSTESASARRTSVLYISRQCGAQ